MSKRVSHKATITNRPTCGGPTKAGLGKGISSKTSLMFTRTVNQKRLKDFPDSCTGGGDSIPDVQNGHISFTTSSDETYSANVRTDFKDFDLSGFFSKNNISDPDITKIEIGKDITTITEFPPHYMGNVIEITLEGGENENFKIVDDILYNADQTTVLRCETNKQVEDFSIPETVKTIGYGAFRSCHGLTGTLTIPDSVTTIGNNAFYRCFGLTGVKIGDSVTSIGNFAFFYCPLLESVKIGDSVTSIGEGAFYYCFGLKDTLTIPNSVETIGDNAFSDCFGLQGVTIGSNVETIGDRAFYGCSGLTSITVSEENKNFVTDAENEILYNNDKTVLYICVQKKQVKDFSIPETVKTIKDDAFSFCRSLTGTLTIGSNVETIGNQTFYSCSGLQSVTIGSNVETIGNDAFSFCSGLTSITVSEGNQNFVTDAENEILYNNDKTVLYICVQSKEVEDFSIPGTVKTIKDFAFEKCKNLTGTLTIPNSVETIGYKAFSRCSGLQGVTIGSNVETIGDDAFYSCSQLTGVTIGDSVTSIGDQAFQSCSKLTGTFTIPNSVETIGEKAFSRCSGLQGVTIGSNVETIGDDAFYGCSGLTSITVSEENKNFVTDAENEILYNNDKTVLYICVRSKQVKDFSIPETVKTIKDYAFQSCSDLTGTLTIGSNVETIGNHTFQSCSGLTDTLTIPDSVTSIGYYAFQNCKNLTGTLTIGDSVTSIGYYAFQNCSLLEGVTIGDSVTSIGNWAFSGCSKLEGVTMSTATGETLGISQGTNVSFYGKTVTVTFT